MRSIFDIGVKSSARAKIVTIRNPTAFRESIRKLRKGRYTMSDYRALILAQNRAKAQLRRKNLSSKERKQMGEIAKIKIPKP